MHKYSGAEGKVGEEEDDSLIFAMESNRIIVSCFYVKWADFMREILNLMGDWSLTL
jgi:hypothetical protein